MAAEEKRFVNGIRIFPNTTETTKAFKFGTVIITPKDLRDWMNENQELATEYKGEKQFKFDIMKAKDKDTWYMSPVGNRQEKGKDDLPF